MVLSTTTSTTNMTTIRVMTILLFPYLSSFRLSTKAFLVSERTIITIKSTLQQEVCCLSVVDRSESFGLTDDGDFAMLGVNCEEPKMDNDNNNDNDEDLKNNAIVNSNNNLFSPKTTTTSSQPVSFFNMNDPTTFGLTDDGDFAIIGINMESDAASNGNRSGDDDNRSNKVAPTDFSASLWGSSVNVNQQQQEEQQEKRRKVTDINSINNDNNESPATVQLSTARMKLQNNTSSRNNDNIIVSSQTLDDKVSIIDSTRLEKEQNTMRDTLSSSLLFDPNNDNREIIKTWLLQVLPTLDKYNVEHYINKLLSIGFHPDCVTCDEVEFDDLNFMKVLHQRYIYKEITGKA